MPGIIFHMTTRDPVPFAGAKTGSPGFATANNAFVSLSLFGMSATAFLKERFFGLTGPEGNHGEDVKEAYWYTDNTPSHSMMRMVYRYPQLSFPYEQLVAANAKRSKLEGEYELWDTGIFDENRFFEIEIEYAKSGPNDILIRATATNCGPDPAPLHLIPTLWFRNTWSWGYDAAKPCLQEGAMSDDKVSIIEAKRAAARPLSPLLRGARAASVHRKRNQPFSSVGGPEPESLRQRCDQRLYCRKQPRPG